MKRLASLSIATLLLAGSALLWAPAAAAEERRWVDYDRGLFLRSGPGRTRSIIGGIEYGEAVVLLRVVPGDWGQVRRGDGSLGYARANHLSGMRPPAKPITWSWTRHLFVTTEAGLNVRSGPGTTFPVIGTLAYGEGAVDCKETARGWTKVRDGLGVVGYVYASYLSPVQPPARLAPVTIGPDGATVYRDRDTGAEMVARQDAGARLDALTGNWDGYIKVRLPDTRTGFILASTVSAGGGSPKDGGAGLVFVLVLAFIGGITWLLRRASSEPPATPPQALESTVPKATPAPGVALPPQPPAPKVPAAPPARPTSPFKAPPLPGKTPAGADAPGAYLKALERDVRLRAQGAAPGRAWALETEGTCCSACRALPFDLIRKASTGEAHCFPCAWNVGWLDAIPVQEVWAPPADGERGQQACLTSP